MREAISPLAEITPPNEGSCWNRTKPGESPCWRRPLKNEHGEVLALLADGEAWSSSALALALDVSPRTVQRALDTLAENGKAEWFGRDGPSLDRHERPGFPDKLVTPRRRRCAARMRT